MENHEQRVMRFDFAKYYLGAVDRAPAELPPNWITRVNNDYIDIMAYEKKLYALEIEMKKAQLKVYLQKNLPDEAAAYAAAEAAAEAAAKAAKAEAKAAKAEAAEAAEAATKAAEAVEAAKSFKPRNRREVEEHDRRLHKLEAAKAEAAKAANAAQAKADALRAGD